MSENFNSHIACEGTDNDINWVCKVCKDLPNYAGMYLYQREREKNQLKNVKDRRADLILLKYYYALLVRSLYETRISFKAFSAVSSSFARSSSL